MFLEILNNCKEIILLKEILIWLFKNLEVNNYSFMYSFKRRGLGCLLVGSLWENRFLYNSCFSVVRKTGVFSCVGFFIGEENCL